jgi:hypothetical protein
MNASSRLRSVPSPSRPGVQGQGGSLHRAFAALIAALVLSAGMAGCDANTGPLVGVDTQGAVLELTPSAVEIDNHTSFRFEARTVHRDGRTIAAGASTNWSSSNSEVATVDAAGRVIARLPGEVTITASERGRSASARLRILRTQADLRLLVADEVVVEAGTTGGAPLEARIIDVAGVPVEGIPVDFWIASGDGSSATLRGRTAEDGRVGVTIPVGTEAGEVTVEVTSPGFEDSFAEASGGMAEASASGLLRRSATVRVQPSDPDSVVLSPAQAVVDVGDSVRFEARVFDRYGNLIENPELTWSAGPSSVASARSTGWVRGLSGGAALIEVVAAGKGSSSIRAEAALEVRLGRTLAAVSGSGQSVPTGATAPDPLRVRVRNDAGNGVPGVLVFWSVRSGSATLSASVTETDASGNASVAVHVGQTVGEIQVEAAMPGGNPVLFQLEAVKPPSPPGGGDDGSDGGTPTNPAQVTDLAVAGSTTASVTLRFTEVDNGAGGPADYHVRYRAGTPFGNWGTATVVTVGSCANPVRGAKVGATRNCTVEGLSPGKEYTFQLVSMRSTVDGIQYSALSNITGGWTAAAGDAGVPVSLSVTPGSSRLTSEGARVQLEVSARDAHGNVASTPAVTWASSNPSIATVDAMGLVTARAAGLVVITASAFGCTDGNANVEVVFPEAPGNPTTADWPNQPAGLNRIAYNDWTAMPGDWGNDRWGVSAIGGGDPTKGSGRIAQTDLGAAVQGFYPAGHEGGYGATRVGYRIGTPPREIFIGIMTKVDAHFVNHPFQLKWHYARMDDGSFLWIDWRDNPNDSPAVSNLGMRFQGNWRPRNHWVNTELVRQNVPQYTAPNYKPFPKGQWVRLELYMRMQDAGQENGIIRLYQDGELILELTDHFFPGTGFRYVYHEGTYGGGATPVPHDQSWYVSETHISAR